MAKERNISVGLEELEQSDASKEKLAEKAIAEGSNSHEPEVNKGENDEEKLREKPSEEEKESNEQKVCIGMFISLWCEFNAHQVPSKEGILPHTEYGSPHIRYQQQSFQDFFSLKSGGGGG